MQQLFEMETKTIFFLVASFLAYNVSGAEIPKVNDPIDEVITLAEVLLNAMTSIISDAIEVAETVVDALITDVEAFRNYTMETTEQLITAELAELNKLIAEVKNNVTPEMQEVLECIEDVENDMSEISRTAANLTSACVEGTVENFFQDILPILETQKSANEEIEKQTQQLEECKADSAPMDCVSGVVNNIISIATKIPADIKAYVAKAQEDFENMENRINFCIANIAPVTDEKFTQLYVDFNNCLNK